jgi:hypothetical protein
MQVKYFIISKINLTTNRVFIDNNTNVKLLNIVQMDVIKTIICPI